MPRPRVPQGVRYEGSIDVLRRCGSWQQTCLHAAYGHVQEAGTPSPPLLAQAKILLYRKGGGGGMIVRSRLRGAAMVVGGGMILFWRGVRPNSKNRPMQARGNALHSQA